MVRFGTNKDSKMWSKINGIFINNVNKFLTTQCLSELQAILTEESHKAVFQIIKKHEVSVSPMN